MPPPPATPPARIVRAAQASPQPLYPPARLYTTSQQATAQRLAAANETVEAAHRDAKLIIDDARAQAALIRAQAEKITYNQAAHDLVCLVDNLRSAVQAWNANAAAESTAIAFAIARSLLRAELTANPEHVAQLAAQALAHARHAPAVALELHPQDAALLAPHLATIATAANFSGSVTIIQSPTLPRASVRIHTADGTYDGSLAVRLAQLEQSFSQSPAAPRN